MTQGVAVDRQPMRTWRICHLLELAGELSLAAHELILAPVSSNEVGLFSLWQTVRKRAGGWQRELHEFPLSLSEDAVASEVIKLNKLGREILAADLLLRVWGSIQVARDRERGVAFAQPILEHVVYSIQYVRSRLLQLVLNWGEPAADVDRFRRRCDRWTDVLIGPILVKFGTGFFAYNPQRAWEFGEEWWESRASVTALQNASLRLACREPALQVPLPASWHDIIQAILAECDADVVQRRMARWQRGSLHPSHGRLFALASEARGERSLLARCLLQVQTLPREE